MSLRSKNLTSVDSGDVVYKNLYSSYFEYTEKKLPQAIEHGIYDKDVTRKKGEGILQKMLFGGTPSSRS